MATIASIALYDRRPSRTVEVVSNNMEPTFKRGDLVVAVPASSFIGDGVYVVGNDTPSIYRVGYCGSGNVRLISDNQTCPAQTMSKPDFSEICLAVVVGVVSTVGNPLS